MLNLQTYHQSYAYEKYSDAVNNDELLTAFVEDVNAICDKYCRMKFDSTKKDIDKNNIDDFTKHQTALPLEIAIDSAFTQFLSFVLDERLRSTLAATFENERKGKMIIDTPLNRLSIKIANAKKVISLFRDSNRLTVKQYYRYENRFLYISNSFRIRFNPNTATDLILSTLFNSNLRACSTKTMVSKAMKLFDETDNDLIFEKLERASEYINNKVTNETHNPIGLIAFGSIKIELNQFLFRD